MKKQSNFKTTSRKYAVHVLKQQEAVHQPVAFKIRHLCPHLNLL